MLICTATEFEAGILRERLRDNLHIRLVHTGVGAVNAAHAVTLAITHDKPRAIVMCGVGGAYPSSGLNIGDVACAEVDERVLRSLGGFRQLTPSGPQALRPSAPQAAAA